MASSQVVRIPGLAVILGLLAPVAVHAQEPSAGASGLRDRLHAAVSRPGLGGLPVHARVSVAENVVQSEILAVFAHRHPQLTALLENGRGWCEIVVLHPNVKACTHEPAGGHQRVVIYTGTKHYQPARLSRAHHHDLRIERREPGYLMARLLPAPDKLADGAEPVVIEAVDIDGERTGLRVQYRQRLNAWTRLASATYFATFGRDKVGFSRRGADGGANTAYVDGLVGAIERNIVRYFLAMETHLAVGGGDSPEKHEQRLAHWFASTERHARQLHELDWEEYLDIKRRELAQSAALQRKIDSPSGK
jgi:hypothetical protein